MVSSLSTPTDLSLFPDHFFSAVLTHSITVFWPFLPLSRKCGRVCWLQHTRREIFNVTGHRSGGFCDFKPQRDISETEDERIISRTTIGFIPFHHFLLWDSGFVSSLNHGKQSLLDKKVLSFDCDHDSR